MRITGALCVLLMSSYQLLSADNSLYCGKERYEKISVTGSCPLANDRIGWLGIS